MRARVLVLMAVAGCAPSHRGVEREVDVVAQPKAPGPEVKIAADAIVKTYELVTIESAMPGDPAKVRAAAIAALGWTSPVPWTTDAAKDRDLLRGTVRSMAQRGALAPDAVLRAARAMTLAAGDVHTFAMTKPALQALFALIDGAPVVQVGMLANKTEDGRWAVSSVMPGGAAQRAGVARGDELVSIDGTPIEHGYIDFAYLLGVAPNTEAKLVVKHGGTERPLVLRLAAVASPILEARTLGETGYVRIWSCTHSADPNRDAAALLGKALADFDRKKVKRLVVDLRGNAGGFPFDLASLLVEADPLMYGITGGEGTEQAVARTKLAATRTKFAIAAIVDESTASGAEMLALALRDHGAAVIVGRPTAGGLTFPTTEKITPEVTVSYPLSRVGGKTKAVLEGNRLAPDLAAPNQTADDFAANRDPQLDAAIAILKQ